MITLIDPLQRALQIASDATAFICGDEQITYQQFHERCQRLAGMLYAHGLQAGDRVAILAANSHRYMEAYVGVPAAGLVVVPLNTRHAEPELQYGDYAAWQRTRDAGDAYREQLEHWQAVLGGEQPFRGDILTE